MTRTSNTTDVNVGTTAGNDAVLVDFNTELEGQQVHEAWTANIPGAQWIWGENPVNTPESDLTESFFDVFTIVGTPTGGTLDIAADNSYVVKLNGIEVGADAGESNFNVAGQDSIAIPANKFVIGENILEITVKNWAQQGGNAQSNPAGLLYKLTINKNACIPTPEPVCNPEVNLLENAGFEAPVVEGWDIISFTHTALKWLGDWVTPQEGGRLGLEIQNHVAGSPAEGNQHAELDGDHPTKIWQNIPTISGNDYALSFKYSPRPGTALGNNVLEVRKDGVALGSQISRGSTAEDTEWTTETRSFTATGASTKIEFADVSATDDSLGTYLDDMKLSCVGPHVKKTTLVATKVVCDTEADLPDWSGTNHVIDATTAQAWVDQSDGACRIDPNWKFQWAPTSESNPGDNTPGEVSGWNTFVSSTLITLDEMTRVWVREVYNSAYILFTGTSDEDTVSAEMYCNGDAFHYDNLDYAQLSDGVPTYCVAFNAQKPIEKGSLIIVKNSVGGDGEFNFTVTHGEDDPILASIETEEGSGSTNPIALNPNTSYTVNEPTVPDGWDFTSVNCAYDDESIGDVGPVPTSHTISVAPGETVTCTYTNTKRVITQNDEDLCPNIEGVQGSVPSGKEIVGGQCTDIPPTTTNSNTGGGIIGLGFLGGGNPGGGLILGVATSTGETCTPYLTDYLRMGKKNNPEQVKLLQIFLNKHLGTNIPVTGFFGPRTFEAVKQFQLENLDQVLVPWVPHGLSKQKPTGYVYKTTKRWINLIECKSLNIPMPQLP
jgi:peptidoglycan hydrolase-like protein with peptidoglycan-binding domain